MYRELVLECSKGIEWVNVQPPCREDVIAEAEKVVGYAFPEELKKLLRELNGDGWLLLSAEEIMENVRLNREIFLPDFEEEAFYIRLKAKVRELFGCHTVKYSA